MVQSEASSGNQPRVLHLIPPHVLTREKSELCRSEQLLMILNLTLNQVGAQQDRACHESFETERRAEHIDPDHRH